MRIFPRGEDHHGWWSNRWLLLLLAGWLLAPAWPAELRVMTFNVRMPSISDGPDYWEHRKDIAVDMVREQAPDVFGTQELFYSQGEYLSAHLSGYRWFGLSRRGNHEDEHMGVFYKTARLELLEQGNYWLSETPETPGSSSWDMSLPRMVTWGRFRLKDTGTEFYLLNTHFPHRRQDGRARVNCAKVIARRIESLPRDVPLLLVGDFNESAEGSAHKMLARELKDAWTVAAERSGPEGTFHGFGGAPRPDRIDWILFRAPWKVLRAETVSFHEGERYPSDHFPVWAVFSLDGEH